MRLTLPWIRDDSANTVWANSPFGRVAVTESGGVYYPTWGEAVDFGRPCSSEGSVKMRVAEAVYDMLDDVFYDNGFTYCNQVQRNFCMTFVRGDQKIEIGIMLKNSEVYYVMMIINAYADILVTLTDRNSLEDALAKYCPRDGSDNSEQKQPINI